MISYSLINHDVAIKLIIPKRMYIYTYKTVYVCVLKFHLLNEGRPKIGFDSVAMIF